jgi:calcineurin-like phosphoesterase family protein
MYTIEQTRELYLKDLDTPLVHPSGFVERKVRNVSHWANISSHSGTGVTEFVNLTNEYRRGRRIVCESDLHLGHKNIIKYCNRPFDDVAAMNDALVYYQRCNTNDDDIVIFGGDIGFLPFADINRYIRLFKGYKILILGNHDITRDGKPYPLEFDEIHISNSLMLENGNCVVFTHIPISNLPKNVYNIHGHLHTTLLDPAKYRSMCVEIVGYKPVELTSLLHGFCE